MGWLDVGSVTQIQGLILGHCVLINNQTLFHSGRMSVLGVDVGWLVCFWFLVESGSKFPLLGWQTSFSGIET